MLYKSLFSTRSFSTLIIVFFLQFFSICSIAQITNLKFSSSTNSYIEIVGGSSLVAGGSAIGAVSSVTPIGFDFVFQGNTFSSFSVNAAGLLKLGSVAVTNESVNNASSITNTPKLYAWWDATATMASANGGGVTFALTGSAPNRILTVQWKVAYTTSATTGFSYQVKLYESTNVIEYLYGAVPPSGTLSASVGLGNYGANEYQSFYTFNNIPSSTLNYNSNTIFPGAGAGFKYTFTPSFASLSPANQANKPTFWLKADGDFNATRTLLNVPANRRTASSELNTTWAATNSVLSATNAWIASAAQGASGTPTGSNQLAALTLDLGSIQTIHGVATLGAGANAYYVKDYMVRVSNDNVTYTDLGLFMGNEINTALRYADFDAPVSCRYVRIIPSGFETYRALRADVYTKTSSAIPNDTRVSNWEDNSGNQWHAYQNTIASQPKFNTNQINFNPAVNFTNSPGTSLNFPDLANIRQSYWVAQDATAAGNTYFHVLFGASDVNIYGPAAFPRFHGGLAGAVQFLPSILANQGGWRKDGSVGSAASLYDFGAQGKPNLMTSFSLLENSPFHAQTISLQSGLNRSWQGPIAEIITFQNQADANQQNIVETYLGIKYGITLGHDYVTPDGTIVWNRTTNSVYHNNVFGLARSDSQGLHQRQSFSTNYTGKFITLGNNSIIGVSNVSSTGNNLAADNAYLLLGDNNAPILYDEALTGNYYPLLRKWKVSNVGISAASKISIPAYGNASPNSLPFSYTDKYDDETVYLTVDTDGDGNFSNATYTAMTKVGTATNTTWEINQALPNNAVIGFAVKKNARDTDGDTINDDVDIDDDNDGAIDSNEQTICRTLGRDLRYVTFNGSAIANKSENTLTTNTTALSSDWISSYSNENFSLPISLKFKRDVITGLAMFGLIPSTRTQTPTNYTDNGYKFYMLNTVIYGYFGTTWNFNQSAAVDDEYSLEISASGAGTVKINGVIKHTFQAPISDYKLVVSASSVAPLLTNIRLVNSANPERTICLDRDTDNDGTPNRMDLDSDGDGCSDAVETRTVNNLTSTTVAGPYGANGLANSLETVADNGVYSGTYTYYSARIAGIRACADTDGDSISDQMDVDDDNDGILDNVECAPFDVNKLTYAAQTFTVSNGNSSSQTFPAAPNGMVVNVWTLDNSFNVQINGTHLVSPNELELWPLANANAILEFLDGTSYTSVWTITGNQSKPLIRVYIDKYGAIKVYGSRTSGGALEEMRLRNGSFNEITLNTNSQNTFQIGQLVVAQTYITGDFGIVNANICDLDGDGISNDLDLDSDGDGCSDALEAGSSTTATSTSVFPTGTDSNNNGLLNDFESATAGSINYISFYGDYALKNYINTCSDTDSDGVKDLIDLDDDNDGVLDATEMTCASTLLSFDGVTISKPNTINYTFNGALILNNLIDGVDNNNYVLRSPTGTLNGEWFRIALPSLKVLNYVEIGHYSGQTLFTVGSTYRVEGSLDGINWTNVSGTLTYNNQNKSASGGYSTYNSNVGVFNNNAAYFYYRLVGINATSGGTWATELYFKQRECTDLDTDEDGIPNRLELDSDGDGCSDAREAGITNSTTPNFSFTGSFGNNGFVDGLETSTESGILSGTYTYSYTANPQINACLDNDNDGIIDFFDIDDDNDGALDVTETTCISYTYTGSNTSITVPAGAVFMEVKMWGAGGGGSNTTNATAGSGAYVFGKLNVTPNETLTLIVGQGGINKSPVATFGGGGAGGNDPFQALHGGSGGGRSELRRGTTSLLIAGGGGGAAGSPTIVSYAGGAGIRLGQDGVPNSQAPNGAGKGGTQSAGGLGGTLTGETGFNGANGAQFLGGNGGASKQANAGAGGGGGGGWYGGGGGAGMGIEPFQESSAGGGSSYFNGALLLKYGVSGNTNTIGGAITPAPNNTDPAYIAGAGTGGAANSAGGNGLIQICYTLDTDGDGIVNQFDLDSDADGCSDAFEAGSVALPTSTSSFPTGTDSNGNGLLNTYEGTTAGTIKYISRYSQYALNNLNNACIDNDADGVPDLNDLDDDNDGVLDTNEQTNCITSGIDLTTLTFNGSAITARTASTITGAGGGVWRSSYSDQNLKLPISLKFKHNITGVEMFGLIPVGTAQNQATWQDGSYKIYPSYGNAYGYFTTTWDFGPVAITSNDVLSIDVSSTGFVTAAVNGVTQRAFQGTVSDYKLTLSSNIASSLTNIILTDLTRPANFACTDIDTDADGIPNRLDLDSDGDNCPDAREAGVRGTLTSGSVTNRVNGNNVTSSVASSIVSATYGVNGFANSIETATESGLYSGAYSYVYATDVNVSACRDTDSDGVADIVDIDDDNDGILDSIECPLTNIIVNGEFTGNTTGWTGSANWAYNSGGFVWNSTDNTNNNVISQNFARPIFNPESSNVDIAFDVNTNGTGYLITSTGTANMDVVLNNTIYATITNPSGGTTASVVARNGATVNVSSINIVNTNVPSTRIIVSVPRTQFNTTNTLGFSFSATTDDIGIDNVFVGSLVNSCDTDSDGRINSKDLDSDGDDCFDAVEAGTTYVSTAVASSAKLTTNVIPGNYGTNGFADGLETFTDAGIYTGTYTYSFAIDANGKACLDTDSDGVADVYDLDDDNDGVLDTVECPLTNILVNGSFTGGTTGWTANANWAYNVGGFVWNAADNVSNNVISQTFARPVFDAESNMQDISFDFNTNGFGWVVTSAGTATLDVSINNIIYATLTNPSGGTTASIVGRNGATVNRSSVNIVTDNIPTSRIVLRVPNTIFTNSNTIAFSFSATNDDIGIDNVFVGTRINTCDTDNDGIVNSKDLDSDGDGCSDASESKTVNSLTATIVSGLYGNNGFANSIETATESGLYSGTYLYIRALDPTIKGCLDSDYDGVADVDDVDDDNDGILDSNECPTAALNTNESNGTFGTAAAPRNVSNTNVTGGYVYSSSNTAGAQYAVINQSTPYHPSASFWRYVGHTTGAANDAYLAVNGSTTVGIFYAETVNLQETVKYRISFWHQAASSANSYALAAELVSSSNVVLATASTGQQNSLGWKLTTIEYTSPTNQAVSFRLKNTSVNLDGNDFSIDDISITPIGCPDTDGDGIPNHLDLDSDGDGCSDANEAYGLTTAQGTDGNQYYGTNPITVDATGKIIGATYTATSLNVTTVGAGSTITAQPTDQSINIGGTAVFATRITAGTGTTTYQWQVSSDGGTTWNNITNSSTYTGAGTLTLTVANVPLSMKGYRYRLNIAQSNFVCGNVTTAVAKLLMDNTPIVVDDNATGNEDTPISGNVLSNDKGSGNPAASITVTNFTIGGVTYTSGQTATIAGVGTIIINANGTYTFTPTANYNGTLPAIDYTATDANGGSDVGTLNLTVTPVNDAPIAVDDNINTNQNIPVSGNVLTDGTDDSDVDGNLLTVSEFKIGSITYNVGTTANIAGVGTIVVNSNGTYTFTPVFGYTGSVPAIDYTIGDGNGGSDIGRLSINVVDVNDAPLATDDIQTINQNTTATGNVLTNDADIDAGASLTVTQYSFTIGGTTYTNTTSAGVVTMTGVGTINITANGAYTFVPTGTFTGTVPPIIYTLSDGSLTSTALLDIYVQPVNTSPIANDDVNSTPEDTPVSGNVLTDGTDDSDAEGNSLTVTEISFTIGGTNYTYPAGSTVSIPGKGTIIVNANGSYTFTPLSNFNGPIPTINYKISDGHGGTANANLGITVTAMNDNPIAVNDDNKITPEDTPVTVNVLTNDSDPDGNTNLTVTQFSIGGVIYPIAQNVLIPGKGTLTAMSNGDFTFTPLANFNGVLPTILYTVSDGVATNTANFNLTVTPVNDAPSLTREIETTAENTPKTGNLLSNDTDIESATASLTITQFVVAGVGSATAVTYTAGSIVDIPNVGTIIVNANGTYTFTPVLGYFGTIPTISYTVTDPNGGLATSTLDITVTPVNDSPVVVSESVLIQEDAIATGNLLTNDTDPENNALTITQFTIAGLSGTFTVSSTAIIPGVGTIIMNANGSYTYTPTANYNGVVPVIEYSVSDGLGGTSNGNLTIVVAAVNDAPIVVNDTKSEPVNTPITGNVLTNDRDVEAATLTVTNITIAGVTYPVGQLTTITGVGTILMNADGSFTFTPALNYVGSLPAITYLVSDGTATSSGTLSLTITPIDADGDGIPDAIEKGNGSTPTDTDGDGTPDYLDSDSDGDGIPDNAEDNVCTGFMPCTPTDTDNDGIPDYRDTDSDGDGILDATEDAGCSGNLPCTPTDTDGDGIPNYRDTDSDGDGITDAIEKGPGSTPADTDGDGTPNYLDLDSDGDGISDAIEKGSSSTPVDTDNDGTPDFKDLDSDGDGIPDSIEKGTGTTPIDSDGDGIPNYMDTDSDGDGILDNNEDSGCTGTAPCTPTDTDGDGTPDYLDLDSDNDGILDSVEKGSGTTPVDSDNDGTADFRDLDSDGDGIVDAIEKGTGATLLDTDGDGTPNYLDLDSDGDGIPDSIEKGAGSSPIDTDNDGTPDYLDTDSDNDGIPDSVEDAGCTGTAPCTPTDTDGDGIPNYKDLDSDGDGISDAIEKGANGSLPVDTDSDGTPDYLDLDSDGDGISDAIEKGTGTTPIDTDGDGIPDYRDTDSDNDGISDAIEKGPISTPVDTDGDGTPDFRDLDSDGDGKPDQSEGSIDTDGDGTPNFRDLDADGDGVLDAVDQCPLVDGLGSANGCPPDSDGDGLIDASDADDDNDGILDSVEAAACSPSAVDCDTDGDGIPNRLDIDSDGDGINDVIEAGGTDANKDGIGDGTTDSNGVPATANGGITPPNTDGTGNTNPYDLDSDGDGISDAIEKGTGATLADTDSDGTPDYLDLDSDGDGITDAIEKGTGTSVADTDNDGIPDFRDLDSDGDAIPDSVEKGSLTNPIDTDVDGIPDYRDIDSDGDGITDITEDVICTGSGTCSPTDTDTDGTPDYLDTDSDGDGIPDTIEKGSGATPVDTDIDGTPDYLDTDADGDGILDSVEDAGCTGTAPCTPTDTDGDGIPNFKDLDSDGDGISDNIEKGAGSTPVDSDSDGTPDYLDSDSDGDGISDAIEKGSGTTPLDTDGDGTPDYLDLDSDGDGIPDSVEKGTTTSPVDTDSDGTPDFLDTDTDGDGIPDSVEDAACSGTACTPTDTDGDGIPNHKDLDSDGDGIPDSIEKGINGATPTDTDGTGNPDYLDTDSDDDGISDAIEKAIDGNNPLDTDGDGTPDYKDTDSDNDGIPDSIEKGSGSSPLDTDGDGIPDYRDTDSDGDGILDNTEDAGCTGTAPCTPTDTDGDGIPNYRDLDSDGDNKTDLSEGETDYDGDGIPNYLDPDSDGDGINDNVDQCPLLPGIVGNNGCPIDTDGDGVYDIYDADDDNDGILDTVEAAACSPSAPDCDTDGDGIPNRLDPDSDNDGINDVIESNGTDVDGDGKVDGGVDANGVPTSSNGGVTPPNTDGTTLTDPYDTDSDGDGISDALEKGPNGNNPVDTDGDGIPDYRDTDSDNDGIPDSVERGTGTSILDTDGDGIPDYKDTDSDGDGILDATEDAGCTGTAPCTPTDTDGDGIPNYRDIDSDGDGINDSIEKGTGSTLLDTDSDGTPNYLDTDSDGDGISDAIEKGLDPSNPIDTDGDGKPDYLDTDSDNDGIPDAVEKGSGTTPTDTDGDGIPNYRDTDSDGDGIIDAIEDDGCTGTAPCTPTDTDGDGIPNYLDLDTDGDGKLDAVEKGPGATPMDSDRDGIPDYRDVDNLGNADVNVTNINTAVTGNLKTNDEVPVGTTYKQPAANASNPSGATIVVNADGTYSFTATTAGKYIYYVPVCGPNQINGCPLSPLEITVLDPLNTDKPVANNDFATIAQGTPIALNVLANDRAGDAFKEINPSSLTVTTAPKHGTAVVNNDGTITYTPSPYFVGSDSLTYQVCDNNNPAQCQNAVAYFKIEPTGVTPVTTAADDYTSMVSSNTSSNTVTGTVLLNDQNSGGGNLIASLISGPSTAQGTLVFNSDGTYSFTPAAGFVGPIDIIYEVCGGSPVDCAEATLHILVNAPATLVDDAGTAFIDIPSSGNISTNDVVPAGTTYGQPAQLTGATIAVGPNGTYTFTATAAGTYTYTVLVCAPGQSTNCPTETLVIVVPVNTLVDDAATAYVNIPSNGNISTNDLVPAGTTYGQPAQLTGATILVGPNGTYTFTATDAGTYTYTIPVCAPGQTTNCPTEILVIVVPVNTLVDDAATAYVNIPTTGNISTNDMVPAGTNYGQPAQLTGATIAVGPNGTYTFTATTAGTYTYTVPVCAPGQTTNCPIETLVIVVPVNTLVNDAATAYVNIPITGNISTNDVVPTGTTYGQPAANSNNPTGATIAVGPNGTYTFTATTAGTYTYTIPVCAPGQTSNCPTETLVIVVPVNTLVNDAATAYVNIPTSGNISTNDVVPAGTTYGQPAANSNNPTGATIAVGPNGTYTFTATTAGTYTYTIPVCAPGQTSNCPTETLVIVVPVNTLVNDAATAYVNIPTSGNISTNDVVPAGTTYGQPAANSNNPTGAIITIGPNGTYTFTATTAGTYTYTIPVCAPGQTINCPTEILVITVPVNTLVNDLTSAIVNVPISGNISTNDVVPVGTTYGQPAQLTGATIIVGPNGTYTFTATVAGTYTYTVLVCAPGQTTNCPTETLVIVVTDPTPPPIPPVTKVLDVTKVAGSAILNLDGSYDITFTIKALNLTNTFIDSVLLKDDLTQVFNNTNGISVVSVITSGGLIRNPNYDGIINTDLVTINSSIAPSGIDSVLLRIKVPSSISGNFQNTVVGTVPTANGLFTSLSTDPTRIISVNDTLRKPTLFVIPKIPLNIPEGFSPNNDGIDDTWVIRKPNGTKVSVWVINRWGNEVYKNLNYNNDWNGKSVGNVLGEDLPEGTYYYIVHGTDINGKLQKLAGSLTIIR